LAYTILSPQLICASLSLLLPVPPSVPRREWAALGSMEKEEAMVGFVKLLNKCCTLFAPYVTSHKIEKEEQERKRYYTSQIWIKHGQNVTHSCVF
jgi:hypothetical protein